MSSSRQKCDKCEKQPGTHEVIRETQRPYPKPKTGVMQKVAVYRKKVKICEQCYKEA